MRRFGRALQACALAGLAAVLPACDDWSRTVAVAEEASSGRTQPAPAACPSGGEARADVATLVERIEPIVVSVRGSRERDPYELLGGGPQREQAIGSGFMIAEDGLALTSAHVVEDSFDIEVRLSDGRTFEADVVGRDPKLDVALLKLRGAAGLPIASLGSSADVKVGESMIVIGNPFGLGPSVTTGIVSATSRVVGVGPLDGLIQTDAAINPGNSGGPVFNARGQVIGIAAAIHARGRGVGFAVPIDRIREVLPELQQTGHVERGRLGIAFQEVTKELARALRLPAQAGALVTEVEPASPAAAADLRPGDVILSMNARPIEHARELASALDRRKPGEVVKLEYQRTGEERTTKIKLDAMQEQAPPAPPGPRRGAGGLGLRASDAQGGAGARIEAIDPHSAAAAHLEIGDVVLEVNGEPIRGAADLATRMRAAPKGADLLLRVRRDETVLYLVVQAP